MRWIRLNLEFARLKANHEQEKTALLLALRMAERREMNSLSQQQYGLLDCEDIKLRQCFLQSLRENVLDQVLRTEAAATEMELKRKELMEALKEYKTIQKLQEKFQAEQAMERQRHEARIVDDIVNARYVREGRKNYA